MKKYTYGLILLYLSMLMMFSIGCGSSGGGGVSPVVPTPNTTVIPNPTPISSEPSTQTTLKSIVDKAGVNYDAESKSSEVNFTLKGTNFVINNSQVQVLFYNVATGTAYEATINTLSAETINGKITLAAGKYLVRVINTSGYTVQQVYFYKGLGSYEVTVK